MNGFFAGVIVLTIFIILTGQGCRYADYIKGQLQEKEGEICIQTSKGVVCGTPEEIEMQEKGDEEDAEKDIGKIEEVKEEVPEEVVGYLPEKVVIEGDLIGFPNLRATDPDGDTITYKFDEPLDDRGEWQTETGDAGEYIVTVYATDGKSEISQDVKIIVKKFNHPPEIEITDITVDEGETIRLEPKITDADGDEVTVSYSGFMDSTEKTTGFKDAGTYTVTITASDGEKTATKDIEIIIKDINPLPVFEEMEDITVKEGDMIILRPLAFDPEREEITFVYQGFMESPTYKTTFKDAGEYEQVIIASDGTNEIRQTIKITIEDVNRPPVFVEGAFD